MMRGWDSMGKLRLQRKRLVVFAMLGCVVVATVAFGLYTTSAKLERRAVFGQRAVDDGRPRGTSMA